MNALFAGGAFDDSGLPESVANILHRCQDVEELFPDVRAADALP